MNVAHLVTLTCGAILTLASIAAGQDCVENGDCPPGMYCQKPPGQCDGPGVCMPLPDGCGGDFDPVCGCDGETYSNACVAAANGVNVAYAGPCAQICGSTVPSGCAPGTYCATPLGECDAQGICLPVPEACPLDIDPVCGCDGVTYFNECDAAMNGVSVASLGPCPTGGDCLSNADCPDGFFCLKPVGECDSLGTCTPRPIGCPDVFDPVCGCDSITYSNVCDAFAEGASVAHQGFCGFPCPADVTHDLKVDVSDLVEVVLGWGECTEFVCRADTNNDHVVDVTDLVNVVLDWGPCPGASQFYCQQTGGVWDPLACGHYVCGVPNACTAIIPGCDCGPGRNFVECVGCLDDPDCP